MPIIIYWESVPVTGMQVSKGRPGWPSVPRPRISVAMVGGIIKKLTNRKVPRPNGNNNETINAMHQSHLSLLLGIMNTCYHLGHLEIGNNFDATQARKESRELRWLQTNLPCCPIRENYSKCALNTSWLNSAQITTFYLLPGLTPGPDRAAKIGTVHFSRYEIKTR